MALTRATAATWRTCWPATSGSPSAPSGRPPGTWTGPAARKGVLLRQCHRARFRARRPDAGGPGIRGGAAGGAGRLGGIAAPVTTPLDGWGYSAQWWHRGPDDGEDYSAMGIYGQYLRASRPARGHRQAQRSWRRAGRARHLRRVQGDRPALGAPGVAARRRSAGFAIVQMGDHQLLAELEAALRQVPTYSARACCPAG